MREDPMTVVEMLNKHSKITVAISIVVVACAVLFLLRQERSSSSGPQTLVAFFTDDDGKTYFEDDANKLSPFDHNGKQAVLCYVYESARGVKFVAYEQKLTDQALKSQLAEKSLKAPPTTPLSYDSLIKRPGELEWKVADLQSTLDMIHHMKCPDGTLGASPVPP